MSALYRPDEDPVAVPALLIWDTPGRPPPRGPFVPPRQKRVRVKFTDGSWRPAEVLRWHPGKDILDGSRVWYLHLRLLIDGRGQVSDGWFVSTWLNAGVPAAQVAEWAGHSTDVLLRVYVKCIAGQQGEAKRRIEDAMRPLEGEEPGGTGQLPSSEHPDDEHGGP